MKKLLILLSILFLSCNVAHIHAQSEQEKKLYVQLIIPDEELGKVSRKFEVPNNFDFKNSLIGGGFATVGCINCVLTSSYQFWNLKLKN